MMILTFDTTLNKTYITLSEDDKIITSKTIINDEKNYHSAYLTTSIAQILKDNKIVMQNIDGLGVNIGPGSFTGIRACVTVARVIAQQVQIPVAGISSLEILSKINTDSQKTLVTLDARKNKAYMAIFDNQKIIEPPKAIFLEDFINFNFEDYFVIADSSMKNILSDRVKNITDYTQKDYPLGEFLANITYNKLKKEEDFSYLKLKPLYIQPPSITISKKEKVGF